MQIVPPARPDDRDDIAERLQSTACRIIESCRRVDDQSAIALANDRHRVRKLERTESIPRAMIPNAVGDANVHRIRHSTAAGVTRRGRSSATWDRRRSYVQNG